MIPLTLFGCGDSSGDGGDDEVGETAGTGDTAGTDTNTESGSGTADTTTTDAGTMDTTTDGGTMDTTTTDGGTMDTTTDGGTMDTTTDGGTMDTTTDGGTMDTTGGGTMDTTGGTMDTTGGTMDTGTGGDPLCGNGVVDDGEECDNGNLNGTGQACLANCVLNVCGDDDVGPDEQCDDGNLINDDGCSDLCLVEQGNLDIVMCGNKVYECGDTLDNDMDGLIDLYDPECTTPCDDDEGSFLTELPGQNVDCKGDCYWDQDSGVGNDGCEWNLKCDPENPGAGTNCEYDPDLNMCMLQQPPQCLEVCAPLVPNGCDCFGCCEVEGQLIYLGNGDCALDNLAACESCTQHPDCVNPCEGECEVCFGQNPNDLPPECNGADCDEGVDSCVDINDCQEGFFCQTGCCIPILN